MKLGTITAEGGDVYSYDEDDMVEDPKLKEHLLHFGINVAVLEKVGADCNVQSTVVIISLFIVYFFINLSSKFMRHPSKRFIHQ